MILTKQLSRDMGLKWRLTEDLIFSCFVFLQYQIAADMKRYGKYNLVFPAIAIAYLILKTIIILIKEFERDDEKPITTIDFLKQAIMISHIFVFFITVIIINNKVSLKDIRECGLKTVGSAPFKWLFNNIGLNKNYVNSKETDKLKNRFNVDPGLMIITQTAYMFLTAQSIIFGQSAAIFIELARGIFGYITISRLKESNDSYDQNSFFSWAYPMFPTIALLAFRLVHLVIFKSFFGIDGYFESIVKKKQAILIIPTIFCTVVGCAGLFWILKIQMFSINGASGTEGKGSMSELLADTAAKVTGEAAVKSLSYNMNSFKRFFKF
ncbi:hypothetical protein CWI42_070680 [Ordospora colligata]|nr:hypothetical protein CWI42_070680 [Ordospora colligata]